MALGQRVGRGVGLRIVENRAGRRNLADLRQRYARFSLASTHGAKKQAVIEKLNAFCDRFKGLGE